MNNLHTQKGQAVLGSVVFFMFISLSIMFGLVTPVVRDQHIAQTKEHSLIASASSEGALEDVYVRLRDGMQVDTTEQVSLNGTTTTVVITDIGSTQKQVVATASFKDAYRTIYAELTTSTGAAFNFGVQSGNGGFIIENSASVRGNVYSNGTVVGANSNIIYGDVVSAGAGGLISGVHATGSAYAHEIEESQIDGNAYYTLIDSESEGNVGGSLFPGSPDQPTASMPISDALIDQWKADAEAGGIISSPCPYTINSNTTLGPVKINCDVTINGSADITLEGAVWIVGNLTIQNTVDMYVDPSVGAQSIPMIADNPSDRANSGKINLQNSAEFFGSGELGSYVMFVSQNNSAEVGGIQKAIQTNNSAAGDILLYAPHGEIHLNNNIDVREVTAYRVRLSNTAEVIYETGLASLLFTSGPGGSWSLLDWKETE